MRIFIIANRIFYRSSIIYRLLLKNSSKICGVAEVGDRHKGQSSFKLLHKRIIFWGIKGILFLGAINVIRKLASIFPIPEYGFYSLEKACNKLDIPYKYVNDINDVSFVQYLKTIKPDLIVSYQHQILDKELLSVPNICCINCHPSILPAFRGTKPIFWAMLYKANVIGVTIHTMSTEIDSGSLICQIEIPLKKDATYFENVIALNEISYDAITKSIEIIENNDYEKIIKMPKCDKYYKTPTKRDIIIFKKNGYKII